jgi:hypothetical protein
LRILDQCFIEYREKLLVFLACGFEIVDLFALVDNLGLGFVIRAFSIILALEFAPEGLVALGFFVLTLGTFAFIGWRTAGLILGFRGVRFLVRLFLFRGARRD